MFPPPPIENEGEVRATTAVEIPRTSTRLRMVFLRGWPAILTHISAERMGERAHIDLRRGCGRNFAMTQATMAGKSGEVRSVRRKPESLAKLKRAARKLFVERGYHATRPQDIAREAGLGHGTFYLHYPDKKACFLAFVDDAREELHEYMMARQAKDVTLESTIAANLK